MRCRRPAATAVWYRYSMSNHLYCAGEGELMAEWKRPIKRATRVKTALAIATALCFVVCPLDSVAWRHAATSPESSLMSWTRA